jgi:outer membrane protein assembly factor BamB
MAQANLIRLAVLACVCAQLRGLASDWPQFLGPTRDGIYRGEALADSWPAEGPSKLWQKEVGQGFSGPVVAQNRVVLFHRLNDQEVIECLDAKTGSNFWTLAYPTAYRDDFGFDEGPRATPCIAEGRVFSHGAEGMVTCADFQSGKKIWSIDTRKEFHWSKGFFGVACSPLVEGQAMLLNIGGRDGAGIVAFDTKSGKILWRATQEEASYASPVVAEFGGRRAALFLTKANLTGLDPVNGTLLFSYPFRPGIRASVSAATPIVVGNLVFLSASYGAGALLLEIKDLKPKKVWANEDALSNHYATSIHHKGFLYGIHGRADPGFEPPASLRCIELKTGKLRWEKEAFGAATLTLAGDDLLVLTEKGELIRAPASPDGFKPSARAQVLPNVVRAHPALASGLLYARSKDKLFCLDLRQQTAK